MPPESPDPSAANTLDDHERIALVDYCCGWLEERYAIRRVPVSPEQILFYDQPMPELLWDTPTPQRLRPRTLPEMLFGSGVAGCIWTLIIAAWAAAWDLQVLFWSFLSLWLLLIFPVVVLFHRRIVATVEEADSAPALAAGLGMGCFNSGLLRWSLHRLADLLLLPALMSYSGAVRTRMERDYALAHGLPPRPHKETPLLWRRGSAILDYLEKKLGPDGFAKLIRMG